MGLLEQEIKEIRAMINGIDAGKVDPSTVNLKLKLYKESEKRTRLMLNAFVVAAQFRNKPLNRAFRANIIGDGTALEIEGLDPEEEKVKCPGMDFQLIKRSECLDYSGHSHFEDCDGCETGLITKKVLLGEKV